MRVKDEAQTALFKELVRSCAAKTFHLGYKNQSVYDVSGTSSCFSQIITKHINTVWAERTVVEC
jgi:hypothetical protein